MIKFKCRFISQKNKKRCSNIVFRHSIGDLLDFPFCDECSMIKNELVKFRCRFISEKNEERCSNHILRDNIGDLLDYPFCEKCQEKFGNVTRKDNAEYSKLL